MGVSPNALSPSLVNELSDIKRRISALERKPATLTRFDRYPVHEWAAVGRGKTANNAWSSCGVANVTGLMYDRVQVKFLTDRFITGKREGEVRLAAIRHTEDKSEIVSASRVLQLKGSSSGGVNSVVVNWIHGIPYGWDYDDGVSVYTIELQHRYLTGPDTSAQRYLAAPVKTGATSNDGLRATSGTLDGETYYQLIYQTSKGWGYTRVPFGDDDGSYHISAFHYCVGLPPDRADATTDGIWFTAMPNLADGGPANLDDPWLGA